MNPTQQHFLGRMVEVILHYKTKKKKPPDLEVDH